MKVAIIALVLLLGSASHAVRIGDFAKYNTVSEFAGDEDNFQTTQEIVNFSHEFNSYEVNHVVVDMKKDKVIHQNTMRFTAKELNSKFYQNPGKNCEALDGELETIVVPAGEFLTCKVTVINKAKVKVSWLSYVPFQIIRDMYKDYDNGTRVITELIEYNFQSPE